MEKINKVDLNNLDLIYKSINYGDFKIVNIFDGKCKSRIYVEIEFLNSGNRKKVRLDHVIEGSVRDNMLGISFTKEYDSKKFGKFKILRTLPHEGESRMVEIKFLNTGSMRKARLDHVKTGNVADLDVKPIYGVAEYGICNIPHNELQMEYSIWTGMISRCLNKNNISFKAYGGSGVTVCDRWLTFSNFVNDVRKLYNYDKKLLYPDLYHLDKDYLQMYKPKHEKIYSPETCLFLYKYDNENIKFIETYGNKNIGILQLKSGLFRTKICLPNNKYNYAYYSNFIAAQNAYNFYYLLNRKMKFELIPLVNDCYIMQYNEFIKYNVRLETIATVVEEDS